MKPSDTYLGLLGIDEGTTLWEHFYKAVGWVQVLTFGYIHLKVGHNI